MDDLISRQRLLEYIHGEPVGRLLCDKYNLDGLIEQLPPAEPKRGKWIEIINSRCVVVALRCSRCEKSPRHGVRSDFCPNCGADMREVTT